MAKLRRIQAGDRRSRCVRWISPDPRRRWQMPKDWEESALRIAYRCDGGRMAGLTVRRSGGIECGVPGVRWNRKDLAGPGRPDRGET